MGIEVWRGYPEQDSVSRLALNICAPHCSQHDSFISFVQDTALIQPKMVYASSKESLKRALSGIADEIQASDPSDVEYSEVCRTDTGTVHQQLTDSL